MPTIYSSSNDGHIEAHSGLSFATNRDATSGTAIYSSSTRDSIAVAAQKFSGRGGTTYRLRRVFFDFDTSGISVTPSSAIFKLYGYLKNVASFFVVKSTQSASLSAGNFDAITGWTAGADNSSNVTKYSSEISSMNMSINRATEAWIDGSWQLSHEHENYMELRKFVAFHPRHYSYSDKILKNKEPYLAVHWKQSWKFNKAKSHFIGDEKKLVKEIKKELKRHNLKKVYIATDAEDKEILKYIHDKLPTFKHERPEGMHYIHFNIIEAIICSKAKHFIGTPSSYYSIHIYGERLKNGYTKDKQEFKILK